MNEQLSDELGQIAEDEGSFAALGLRPEILSALSALGYEEPTPIQREAIPLMVEGRDLLGQAATGTGKTAAFALPILQRLRREQEPVPAALVLVPTRELAIQVSEAISTYGRELGARVVPVYGGQAIGLQLKALSRGAHVVVATPGRALDHIRRGTIPLHRVEMVVLDEADEMLDMGFAEDIEEILGNLPTERQTVLFSATMPPRINSIAKRHQKDPITIRIANRGADAGPTLVTQRAYIVTRYNKAAALGRVLDIEAPTAAIVFCRTRTEVDELSENLNARGYRAEPLHGGMSQEQRDRVMGRMRAGTAELLIATDVAARGLDLDQLTHVVNYDVPSAPEAYVHRIGRVGRAGREGIAITIAEPREQRLLGNIERLTRQQITISPVPTVADLRNSRLQRLTDTLRAAIAQPGDDDVASVVDALSGEFNLRDIAIGAVRLANASSVSAADTREIPDASVRTERPARADRSARPDRSSRPDRGGRDERPVRANSHQHGDRPRERSDDRGSERAPRRPSSGTTRLYIGLGSAARVTPGDLVGAIANETDLVGREIGPIKVSKGFSVVGVPDSAAERVMTALRRTTIKGKKVTIRRYVDDER